MNYIQNEAKRVIGEAVKECRSSFAISSREIQEVLISLAGDLALEAVQASEPVPVLDDDSLCPNCDREYQPRWRNCPNCGHVRGHDGG